MQSKVILEKQDMTHLSWSRARRSSGTAGSFLKAQEETAKGKFYYKLSDYDPVKGIVGHEAVNEIIADRLLTILGIPHISYQLIHADVKIESKVYDTFLCASESFRKPGEKKIALDAYYDLERKHGEMPIDFCIRKRWGKYIYEMLAVDYLILNRDRHGANLEVLCDHEQSKIRLAPLFDHGLSFLFSCKNNEQAAGKFDVMEERKVQCFVGGHSAAENLNLIPYEERPHLPKLKESDREMVFEDLEMVLSGTLRNKIWEMIWKRMEYYESVCNQG